MRFLNPSFIVSNNVWKIKPDATGIETKFSELSIVIRSFSSVLVIQVIAVDVCQYPEEVFI
ncbi:hypothetical protein Nos7524_0263 [Nostoc sp. PCC 7524]|nr:hypothetical protein Nos7524_0263 [Nostoc sp. PCC 7524]